MKNLIAFIQKLPFVGKVLSVIIITLIAIILTFFNVGCAFHLQGADNVTGSIAPLKEKTK